MTLIKQGDCEIRVLPFYPETLHCLEEMYDRFTPKASFQGMPPFNARTRRKWIKHLVENGDNYLAWMENRVMGHVVILPDHKMKDAEYLIFVHQAARGAS
jgi:hypothetical protein